MGRIEGGKHMKKLLQNKKLLITISMLLLLLFGGAYKYNTISTVEIDGNYPVYNSLEELEINADLIIVGHPIKEFSKREHITTYYDSGDIQDMYTLTEIKIKENIKKPSDSVLRNEDTITIIEPVGLIQEFDGKKKIVMHGYSELKKDSDYIIFLTKNTHGNYAIIGNNLGKYNIDGTDLTDTLSEHDNEDIKLGEHQEDEHIKKLKLFRPFPFSTNSPGIYGEDSFSHHDI